MSRVTSTLYLMSIIGHILYTMGGDIGTKRDSTSFCLLSACIWLPMVWTISSVELLWDPSALNRALCLRAAFRVIDFFDLLSTKTFILITVPRNERNIIFKFIAQDNYRLCDRFSATDTSWIEAVPQTDRQFFH